MKSVRYQKHWLRMVSAYLFEKVQQENNAFNIRYKIIDRNLFICSSNVFSKKLIFKHVFVSTRNCKYFTYIEVISMYWRKFSCSQIYLLKFNCKLNMLFIKFFFHNFQNTWLYQISSIKFCLAVCVLLFLIEESYFFFQLKFLPIFVAYFATIYWKINNTLKLCP